METQSVAIDLHSSANNNSGTINDHFRNLPVKSNEEAIILISRKECGQDKCLKVIADQATKSFEKITKLREKTRQIFEKFGGQQAGLPLPRALPEKAALEYVYLLGSPLGLNAAGFPAEKVVSKIQVENGVQTLILHGNGKEPKQGNFKFSDFVGTARWEDTITHEVYDGQFNNGLFEGLGTHILGASTYKGEFLRGLRTGYGVETNGQEEHQGLWKEDKFHGIGEEKDAQGVIYRGIWRDGRLQNTASIIYPDGGIYSGKVLNHNRHGTGSYTLNGTTYIGNWQDDQLHKATKVDYANGNEYEGELQNFKRHGQGSLTVNGDTYIGIWQEDHLPVAQKITYKNGKIYEGDLNEQWQWHGRGTLTVNGDKFTGEWNNGVLPQDSHAEVVYANGDTFSGKLQNFTHHGPGVLKKNGITYEGTWSNGILAGQVKVTYALGDVYEGGWRNGMQDGQGKMTYKNRDVYEGSWSIGIQHGQGKMTYFSKSHEGHAFYEGEWSNGLPHGNGKERYLNTSNYTYATRTGVWKNGIRVS